ncbi:SRPBCC family protein [Microbacterium sp. NPDC089698]|uniref:SRPBCC family protein n=1 Tax=Microbacterium sp. NPDC089698 TaxID=3364200 RepID=UPI0037F24B48
MNTNSHIQSRHVSRVIDAAPDDVYDVLADPGNLPEWARGLASSEVRRDGADLLVDSPMGEVRVHFVPRNPYRIADHDVTLPSGTTVNNPLRVLAHPNGSEVVFTVRQIELTDDEFERDCAAVADDLERLSDMVERR